MGYAETIEGMQPEDAIATLVAELVARDKELANKGAALEQSVDAHTIVLKKLIDEITKREELEALCALYVVWQGRASRLVNLIDPTRSFVAGEFENLDDTAWATLVAELRGKALTNEKVILAQQVEAQKAADRQAALAKLNTKDREALGV